MNGQLKTIAAPTISLVLITAHISAQECGEYEVTAIIAGFQCGDHLAAVTPFALNEAGDVAGYVTCSLVQRAFRWTAETGLEILQMPPGASQSRAIDINNHPEGQIVGTVDISGLGTRAFLIDGGKLTIIPPPNRGTFSSVAALNNKRQVVGSTADGTPYSKGYIWEDEVMNIIEPTFGPRSAARDINEAGMVVGWMGTSFGIDSHAFVWEDAVLTDLGLAPNTFATWARGINNLDEVLVRGEFDENEPTNRINGSFVLRDDKFIDLGQLPGYDVIDGIDLNDQSQIVGLARAVDSSDEPDVGFLWRAAFIENLNDLIDPEAGLTIDRAVSINELGQILAQAASQELNATVAVILTPIEGPLGDLNGDCEVGVADLLILLASWGPCNDCSNCPADFNADCAVGVVDLLVLLTNWG